jgi:hypothetical protein
VVQSVHASLASPLFTCTLYIRFMDKHGCKRVYQRNDAEMVKDQVYVHAVFA